MINEKVKKLSKVIVVRDWKGTMMESYEDGPHMIKVRMANEFRETMKKKEAYIKSRIV